MPHSLRSSQVDRLRGIAAVQLIDWGRRLLGMPGASSGDFDTCVHCNASGCEWGTAEHAPDCPSATGIYVVTLRDLWPHGPAVCDGCSTTLWPGDSYSHIQRGPDVLEVACLGCVARHELLGADQ